MSDGNEVVMRVARAISEADRDCAGDYRKLARAAIWEMPRPDPTSLPVHLAKRVVENRGGEAAARHGRLEIRRSGQFLGFAEITDGCVDLDTICSVPL